MTGVAADADELVQETFIRALTRPPELDRPVKPWLTKVALRLSQDRLRRRRRQSYTGPWLPSPLEGEEALELAVDPEARLRQMESLSFGYLLALEALTPRQRAVLLLREVFELSAAECAEILEISEGNVKITLHRARRALAAHPAPTPQDPERVAAVMSALLRCMAMGDLEGAKALFAEDSALLSDGGGEFSAARVPVLGPEKIVRFLAGLMKFIGPDLEISPALLSGAPAVIGRQTPTHAHQSPTWTQQIELDERGQIRTFYSVLATRKLSGLRPRG